MIQFLLSGLICLIIGCSLPGDPPDRGASWSKVVSEGGGRITILYVPAEGFAETNADGVLTGVTVDLMRAFLEWLEEEEAVTVQADFVAEQDWQRFYQRVVGAEAGVFGLGNVTITEERREELTFSPPYMTNTAVLISPPDVEELDDWSQFASTFEGLTALAFEGTLHESRLRELVDQHYPSAPIMYATSNADIIDQVASGGYFAYLDGYNVWRAQERGIGIRHHRIGDDSSESFGVIMSRGSDWENVFARFVHHYARSSALRSLYETHLGSHLAPRLTPVTD